MKIPIYLHAVYIFALVFYHASFIDAAASLVRSNHIEQLSLIESLKEALKERALIRAGPLEEPKPRLDLKRRRFVKSKNLGRERTDILRQELAKETQDNCLAKLLCGGNQKKTNTNPTNDYALLVKQFFEFFGGDDGVPDLEEEKKNAEEDKQSDDKADDDDDDDSEDEGRSEKAEIRDTVNITTRIEEEVLGTSTSATVNFVTTGATITDILTSMNPIANKVSNNIHKVTLEELVGDFRLTSNDVNNMRKSRNILSVETLNQSDYVKRKIRELRVAKSDSKKLRIAGQIASSIRQPRQCKQFNSVASEILSTCPLTSEVVRYFNSNLKNGSQIAIVKNDPNASSGGLVIVNDKANKPYTYFLDNSPINANSKVTTDLKNPSVPDRFTTDIETSIYGMNPSSLNNNVNQISIKEPAFPPKKNAEKEKVKDEDSTETEDEDDDDEEEDEEEEDYDEEEEGEESQDEEQDDGDEEEDEPKNIQKNNQVRSGWKVMKRNKKVKKETKPPQGIQPGMIKVYGIPQPSFHNEFMNTAGQIGKGPIVNYDHDEFEDHIPYPPRPRPPVKSNNRQRNTYNYGSSIRQKQQLKITRLNAPKSVKTVKPKPKVVSSEEEDEEDVVKIVFKDPSTSGERHGPPTPRYFTTTYGNFPAPRAEEYYRNGRPRHFVPSSYNTSPINIRPESTVRGRLNFIPNPPGSGLIRPHSNNRYFSY